MLELIERSEHRIYRILSDDAGIPEEELEPAEESEAKRRRGRRPRTPA